MLDLLHAEAIGIGIALGRVEVERFDEMAIDQRMLSGDLRCRAARNLASYPAPFQDEHRQSGLGEQIGGGESDNSRAHYAYVRCPRGFKPGIEGFARC